MLDIVSHCDASQISWQNGFLEMLPEIEQRLRVLFVISSLSRWRMPSKMGSSIACWHISGWRRKAGSNQQAHHRWSGMRRSSFAAAAARGAE